MKEYVCYTEEGECYSPNGNPIDNYQILAFITVSDGVNANGVRDMLVNDDDWIISEGYDKDLIKVAEVIR